jgi:hypothetical protein
MKKYFFGIIAVALAIGFSAFTTDHKISNGKNAKFIDVWYEYNGIQTTTDRAKKANYTQIVGTLSCAPPLEVLCGVKLPDVAGSNPAQADLNNIVGDIEDAVFYNIEQSFIELKPQ